MSEIRQKIISCPTCHQYYDANLYAACPYCGAGGVSSTLDGSGSFSPTIDPSAGGNFTPTIDPSAPSGGAGAFTPTVAPGVDRMSKTVSVDPSAPAGAEAPVVGWLVATTGPARGRDYRIHTGYNSIGRERGDICIHGDNTISAEKDANLTYVFQNKKFYIAHDSGKNVLLVNNLPVIGGSTELKDFDVITIGNTKLIFIGLCGERFSWDDEGAVNG